VGNELAARGVHITTAEGMSHSVYMHAGDEDDAELTHRNGEGVDC
jgi:hypothetical protein